MSREVGEACPKCARQRFTLRYCPGAESARHGELVRPTRFGERLLPHEAEALHVRCDTCEFQWLVPTAEQAKATADLGRTLSCRGCDATVFVHETRCPHCGTAAGGA